MEGTENTLSHESIEKMKDLFHVGTKKLVGYLPLRIIKSYSNISYEDTIKYIETFCKENNLKFKIIKNGTTSGGALYVWDSAKLNNFWDDNKELFTKYGIFNDEQYISKIEHTTYLKTKHPKMYELIGQSFSDTRFENIFDKYKDVKYFE